MSEKAADILISLETETEKETGKFLCNNYGKELDNLTNGVYSATLQELYDELGISEVKIKEVRFFKWFISGIVSVIFTKGYLKGKEDGR